MTKNIESIYLLQIELFHSNEPLEDEYTLMDIAHIYSWRMVIIFEFFYLLFVSLLNINFSVK